MCVGWVVVTRENGVSLCKCVPVFSCFVQPGLSSIFDDTCEKSFDEIRFSVPVTLAVCCKC